MVTKKIAKGRDKSRRHGYRGYGSGVAKRDESYGGAVHWGRGFTGIGIPAGPSEKLPEAGLFSEDLKEKR
ncbi:MAG TPA: hypothetical protein VIB08_05355 [Thermoanaerobaculia bacterium]|jgi:hypothetical protein